MRNFYEKHEVLFACFWIAAYCFVISPVKSNFGFESIWMLLALALFSISITVFVKSNHYEKKFGIDGWPENTKRYLYFIPMWVLATGNLWDGISLSYHGFDLVIAVLNMAIVGYVEEMLFRGFLFKALLSENKKNAAVIISAVTFGSGHIVNLFSGQSNIETFLQIIFAISWGFILTLVFFKSGSLIPCITAHSMIDVFSLFGTDNKSADLIYIVVTIVVGAAYCIYLNQLREDDEQ